MTCTPNMIVELDPPGHGNFQGAYCNSARTVWYVPEALKLYNADKTFRREDTVMHRYTAGKWDSMLLQAEEGASIHLTGMGVEDDGTLWVTWNDSTGYDVVTLPYRPGTIALKADADKVGLSMPGNYQVSLSPTRTRIACRRIQDDTETYERRVTEEVRTGSLNRQFGVPVVIPRRPERIVQGFGLWDYRLFIATGLTPYAARIEEWDFHTGELVAHVSAEHYGHLFTDVRRWSHHELEGVQGGFLGVKLGSGTARRFRVFDMMPTP